MEKKLVFLFYLLSFVFMSAMAQNKCNIKTKFTSSVPTARTVKFNASISTNASGYYQWNFGDGTTAIGKTVKHTFPSSGKYNVCVTFVKDKTNRSNDSCVASYCDKITIAGPKCNVSTSFASSKPIDRSVNFFGKSSNNSAGLYKWTFTDGTIAWGKNVSHTFPTSGTYGVCLTFMQVQRNFPSDTCMAVFCDSISIKKPKCKIDTKFISIGTPNSTTVNLFGISSPDTSGIYNWSFGDGSTAIGRNVNHSYNSPGTYTVCLTYSKAIPNFPNDTCHSIYCDSITIESPACNISTSYTSLKDSTSNSVTFFGNSSEGNSGSYIWNFGDGSTGWGKYVNHTFSNPGTYPVCVTYVKTQANGLDTCYAFFCDSITIESPACNISTSFTSIKDSTSNSVTFFGNSSEGNSGHYIWNFGDGTTGWGKYINHTFANAGTYPVCLTYVKTQANGLDTCYAFFCDSIIIEGPACNISTSFTSIKDSTYNSVTFFGNSSEGNSGNYLWNFGDGSTGWGRNAIHTYSTAGNYTVCLTYMKMKPNFPFDTCYTFFCDSITIESPACNISTSFISLKDSTSNSVTFFGNSSEGNSGNYIWNFGDGSTGWGRNAIHTYSTAGNYTVCLTYMKMRPNFPFDTCYAFFCDSITIESPACNISTSFTSLKDSTSNSVTFLGNSSEGNSGNYLWNFGDGSTGWGRNAIHTYSTAGNYTVCLTYMKMRPNFPFDTCYAFFCDNITIESPACNVSTSFTSLKDSTSNSVTFFGNSSEGNSGHYIWNFGDGTTGWGKYVHHTFSNAGTFTVCLTYMKTQGNGFDTCYAVFCDIITIENPVCNYSTSFTSRNDSLSNSVAFFGKTSNEANGFYTWNFGDGSYTIGKNVTHIFPDTGTYVVCLTYIKLNLNFPFDTCRTDFCDTVTVKARSAINEPEKIDPISISLFPIPASDRINYELSNGDTSAMTIEVVNHFGEVVKRSDNRNGNYISVYDLKEGFYILRVKSDTSIYLKGFLKN